MLVLVTLILVTNILDASIAAENVSEMNGWHHYTDLSTGNNTATGQYLRLFFK